MSVASSVSLPSPFGQPAAKINHGFRTKDGHNRISVTPERVCGVYYHSVTFQNLDLGLKESICVSGDLTEGEAAREALNGLWLTTGEHRSARMTGWLIQLERMFFAA